MTTPADDIEAFLKNHAATQGRRLEVAIVYADSMLRELRVAVAQWEETTRSLRRMKGEATSYRFN